jgi:hypothetical protein
VEKCEAPPERGRRAEELADGHSPLPAQQRHGGREAGRRERSTPLAWRHPKASLLNVNAEASIEWFPTTSLN